MSFCHSQCQHGSVLPALVPLNFEVLFWTVFSWGSKVLPNGCASSKLFSVLSKECLFLAQILLSLHAVVAELHQICMPSLDDFNCDFMLHFFCDRMGQNIWQVLLWPDPAYLQQHGGEAGGRSTSEVHLVRNIILYQMVGKCRCI